MSLDKTKANANVKSILSDRRGMQIWEHHYGLDGFNDNRYRCINSMKLLARSLTCHCR